MRMLDYQLTDMSAEGKAALPKILDEMGYTGRYVISDFGISINSNATVLSRAVKKRRKLHTKSLAVWYASGKPLIPKSGSRNRKQPRRGMHI